MKQFEQLGNLSESEESDDENMPPIKRRKVHGDFAQKKECESLEDAKSFLKMEKRYK